MTRLKRFKAGLFTITLGMVLVGASFVLADDKAVAEGIILPDLYWKPQRRIVSRATSRFGNVAHRNRRQSSSAIS